MEKSIFLICFLASIVSIGLCQNKKQKIAAIDDYVNEMNNSRSSMKNIPRDDRYDKEFFYYKDSNVVIWHMINDFPFRQWNYYFKNGKLLLITFFIQDHCESQKYYFQNDKIIFMKSDSCSINKLNKKNGNQFKKKAYDLFRKYQNQDSISLKAPSKNRLKGCNALNTFTQ